MTVIRSCQIEKHIISPCCRSIKIHDIRINRFQELANMIVFSKIFIHIHCNQLDWSISGTLSHTINCSIHQQHTFCLLRHHCDTVCISHLKVIMCMISHSNLWQKMFIQQIKIMLQIILMH